MVLRLYYRALFELILIATRVPVTIALAWLIVPQPWSIVLWDGAFVYNSWRIFLSLCGVPTLIGILCLCFFPESPKFLMSQNRNEKALEVFKKIYSVNTGLPKDNYPVSVFTIISTLRYLTNAYQRSDSDERSNLRKYVSAFLFVVR